MVNEVKFFIHSYEEFMTSENEKLQSVIHALNAANVERYNKVRIIIIIIYLPTAYMNELNL